jgi:Mu transposase, C-terminal domain
VPTRYGHQEVLAKGYVDRVEIVCRGETIAVHPRSYDKADFIYSPLHYLALLEQKTKALDQAAPLDEWRLRTAFIGCGGSWKPGWELRDGASSSRCCG